jgi:hypothetical protein
VPEVEPEACKKRRKRSEEEGYKGKRDEGGKGNRDRS